MYPTSAGSGSWKITELHEYPSPTGTMILVAIEDKIRHYSSGWHTLIDSLTPGKRYSFAEHQGYCYLTNGVDQMQKLYGTDVSRVGLVPPAAAPAAATGPTGSLDGTYQYVYAYERATPKELISNPSLISAAVTVASGSIDVPVVASADPQVQYILIYRTLDLDAGGDPTRFLFVTRLANADQTYNDQTDDANLTSDVQFDNGAPPLAKFLVLHKDMVFYANCPNKEDGGSLVMWSKAGIGEAVPSLNYQYFDRKDGYDITGIASVGDYLVVFKESKLFVMPADMSSQYCFSHEIGCVAGWSIIQLEYEIVFLSQHGWFSFDGANLYDLSQSIRRPMIEEGYIRSDIPEAYYGVHYALYDRFYSLCDHPTNTPRVFCGQLLIPLLYIRSGISKESAENIVGWTYHQYPHHHLTSMAMYLDSAGVSRQMGGSSLGYVYKMDFGTTDEGHTIPYQWQSGWTSLAAAATVFKTLRLAVLAFLIDQPPVAQLVIEQDFLPAKIMKDLVAGYSAYCGYCYCGDIHCGVTNSRINRMSLGGKPTRLFRFTIAGDDSSTFQLQSLTLNYRTEGVR